MTPSRSKNAALFIAQRPSKSTHMGVPFLETFSRDGNSSLLPFRTGKRTALLTDLRVRKSRFRKIAVKSLGARIVLGRSDINKHSILLEDKSSVFENAWQYGLFKAGRAFRNLPQNRPLENVHSSINETGSVYPHLFAETNDTILRIHMNGAVSCRIGDSAHRYACPSAMFPVEAKELVTIKLQKGVAIHNQKVGSLRKIVFGKLDCAGRPESAWFVRILDRDIPFAAVAEFFFYLARLIARAHHQAADALRSELQDEQLEERYAPDWGQRLWFLRYNRPQTRPHSPD
jgi:hypothetical protein